jgi:hypothetical protein
MTSSTTERSAFDMFVSAAPRLLGRRADEATASQLGQALSYVLDNSHGESDLYSLIAELEAARSDALGRDDGSQWSLPLSALLGVLRQRLHNLMVLAETSDSTSDSLRDRVILTLRSGMDSPSAIAKKIGSPPTVISRVLRQLAAENLVEQLPRKPGDDKRVRRYVLVPEHADDDERTDAPAFTIPEELTDLADPQTLINFSQEQVQHNPALCGPLQTGLQRIGLDPSLDGSTRVAALSTASVIVRCASPDNPDACLDLSESLFDIAHRHDDPFLWARSSYERVRAGMLADRTNSSTYLDELDHVDKQIAGDSGREAELLRAWVLHTRSLLLSANDSDKAIEYATGAAEHFRSVDFPYGEAAALTVVAREHHKNLRSAEAYDAASHALDLANSHGFLRIMAESNLWAGEALFEGGHEQAPYFLRSASQQFRALRLDTWHILAESSLAVAMWRPDSSEEDAKKVIDALERTRSMLDDNDDVEKFSVKAWADACITRRIAVVARLHGDTDLAEDLFHHSREVYEELDNRVGLAMTVVGLTALRHGLRQLDDEFYTDPEVCELIPETASVDLEDVSSAWNSVREHGPLAELMLS